MLHYLSCASGRWASGFSKPGFSRGWSAMGISCSAGAERWWGTTCKPRPILRWLDNAPQWGSLLDKGQGKIDFNQLSANLGNYFVCSLYWRQLFNLPTLVPASSLWPFNSWIGWLHELTSCDSWNVFGLHYCFLDCIGIFSGEHFLLDIWITFLSTAISLNSSTYAVSECCVYVWEPTTLKQKSISSPTTIY